MTPKQYQDKINKLKEAADRKEKRLLKRLEIAKDKPKKVPIRLLKITLWKLISTKIRNSSDNCFTCSKPLAYKDRSACHFWSKGGHGSVRYDEDNLRVGCNSCNLFKSGNLAEYAVRLRSQIGDKRFDELAERAHTLHKHTREELEALIKHYEDQQG